MRIGIALPSWMYDDKRMSLADTAFRSLARTEPLLDDEEARLLLLVKAGTAAWYDEYMQKLAKSFRVVLKTDEGLNGTEQTLAWGTEWLFDNFNVDYVTWMGDDAKFHPFWLWKLRGLIERHPGARSWSVYRSAFEWMHRTLDDTGEDVSVRSICGHGLTLSRQEWKEWDMTVEEAGKHGVNGTETLDVLHAEKREGERWVTKKSYVEHTGKEGVHCDSSIPEFARDFVKV